MSTWYVVAQTVIVVFGVPAVFCSQSRSALMRKYAPLLGLLGQPAWFYSAIHDNSFGVFVLCVLYTISWAMGFYFQWIKTR